MKKMKNVYRKLNSGLVGVLVTLLVFSCSEDEVKNGVSNTYCLNERFKSEVEMIQPIKTRVSNEIQLTGVVKSNPDNVVSFNNLVDGVIVKSHFQLGDKISKGQILAEVKSIALSEFESKQKILTSKLKVKQHEYASVQEMYKDGIASTKEINKALSKVTAIQSELNEIDANLQFYNASQKQGVFLIKAPTSGYIIEKNMTQGMHVSAYGDPLFTISKLSNVWVYINIHASQLTDISEGMDVEIRSLSYPDSLFYGKVNAISHILDDASGVVKARVELHNKDLLLKPGMFVNVIAKKKTNIEALRIPTSTLIFDDNKNYVVLYKDDCDLIRKQVDYISQNKYISYVALDQLHPDDRIINKNQLLIYEQIKNSQNTDE